MPDVDEATVDRVLIVSVPSVGAMTEAVGPLIRERKGGLIVNIGAAVGIRPRPRLTWHNASNAAVNRLSKSVAAEHGSDNIRVNAVCPVCPVMGITALIAQFLGAPDTPTNRAWAGAAIPFGRRPTPTPTPKHGAGALRCLASDAGRFITGIELPVDGGRTI